MKRARDVREQLEGLMQRVEIEIVSNPLDSKAIRKVNQPQHFMFRILIFTAEMWN